MPRWYVGDVSIAALLADLAARPGMDTRGWIVNGTVDIGTEQDQSVQYVDVNGKRMAPLVNVLFHPSGIRAPCRVLGQVAGAGEADWFPFADGDEVIVAIPGGDERNGAFIIGRGSNDLDPFPETVAGLPTDKNNFAFRRIRTSFVQEVDGGLLFRSARTGAQMGFLQDGTALFNDGAGNRLFMGADGWGLGTKPRDKEATDAGESAYVQGLYGAKQVLFGAGKLTLLLDAAKSQLLTPGVLALGTCGVGATGHAVTLEQLTAIISNVIILLNTATAFSLAFTAAFAGGFPGTLTAIIGAAITAAATPAPATGATPGGDFTVTGLQTLINAALAAQGADPQSLSSGVPIFRPGVGRAGFTF